MSAHDRARVLHVQVAVINGKSIRHVAGTNGVIRNPNPAHEPARFFIAPGRLHYARTAPSLHGVEQRLVESP